LFTASYEGLKPYVKWYEWGDKGGLVGHVTQPGRMPADHSPLTKILDDVHHVGKMNLTTDERRRIYLWLDGNAAFYGTYTREERLAQRKGAAVAPPELQ
jgi:hypothetical protein